MNVHKIAFIICVSNDIFFRECVSYLNKLEIPKGMDAEVVEIRQAESMAAGYNEGMRSSDAKYKVYLHQDVFIVNTRFIYDILSIFSLSEQIGMIGLVGSPKLPADAVMWHGPRVRDGSKTDLWENYRYQLSDGVWNVQAVDGLLIATQYDLPWRSDIMDGWDFYDISQSYEMQRAGYKVVVPIQNVNWYVHDEKPCLNLWNYNKYRNRFLKEYMNEEGKG